jgi:16S rRNA (cytosine1402-N4)-methyltransferase
MDYGNHYSVMKEDVIQLMMDNFPLEESFKFADLTFGAGGHACEIANLYKLSEVYSFDQDPEAIENGKKRIQDEGLSERVHLIHSNFMNFSESLPRGILLDAVLLDAGVSSHQFDKPERGFSFRFDAPLDMRMNPSSGVTAADLLNGLTGSELEDILKEYGEEKFSKQISQAILDFRKNKKLETTKELENICFHAYPKKLRHGKIHPATKTFQALRIKVNDEISVLDDIIGQVIPRLALNGIFMVISFHSLEDRVFKRGFKDWREESFPIEVLTKKPLLPSDKEIFENSRSRSAKLRVIRRVKEWPSKNKYPRKE